METIQSKQFTLKQILQQNWCSFLDAYHLLVQWYVAYNVWKVINCREPDGLGYSTFACPTHPSEIYHVPRTCKSRFCSTWCQVQIDKWVTDVNRLFPTVPIFISPLQSRHNSEHYFLKNDLYLMLFFLQVRKQSFHFVRKGDSFPQSLQFFILLAAT